MRKTMKRSITLFIDTSEMYIAKVALEIDGERHEKNSKSGVMKSQIILPLIEEILAEHTLTTTDLTAMYVVTGPGSYTGIRVGLAVANMLGALLHIPVNGSLRLAAPTYS